MPAQHVPHLTAPDGAAPDGVTVWTVALGIAFSAAPVVGLSAWFALAYLG